jgi:hypothetical protein
VICAIVDAIAIREIMEMEGNVRGKTFLIIRTSTCYLHRCIVYVHTTVGTIIRFTSQVRFTKRNLISLFDRCMTILTYHSSTSPYFILDER